MIVHIKETGDELTVDNTDVDPGDMVTMISLFMIEEISKEGDNEPVAIASLVHAGMSGIKSSRLFRSQAKYDDA